MARARSRTCSRRSASPSSTRICWRAKSSRPARRCSARSPRISAPKCCRRTAAWIAPPCASGCSRIPRKDSGWSSSHIPAIRELTDARCESATGPYVMVAIPLLVETRAPNRFDRVLVVDCDPELQLARLQARDGITREQAAAHARGAGHARAATRGGRRRDPEQRRHRELARPGGKAASAVLVCAWTQSDGVAT